jgi:membrane-associated phospholipid phosphatase
MPQLHSRESGLLSQHHFCMPQETSDYRAFLWAALLALAGVAALAVDIPIARVFQTLREMPTVVVYLGYFNNFEFFGHGFGVVCLLLVAHQLAPGRRWAIPRVAACAIAGGVMANLIKVCVLRTRPYSWNLDGTVWTTFGQWLPGVHMSSSGQSFPSAHTATAVAFAVGLAWLYPQGRFLFAALAALVGCQRIVCGAHYPSDVLIGAAAGYFAVQFVLNIGPLPRCFERWEERWRGAAGG